MTTDPLVLQFLARQEEALTEEILDQLMGSSEFEFNVRFGGTISMSARNYVAMKTSRENK